MQTTPMRIYIGTYTQGGSEGIYTGALDLATGRLEGVALAARAEQPSFLTVTPEARLLYAVSEADGYAGRRSGAVSAYAVSPQTGRLTLINSQSSGGPGPCHLSLDPGGRFVLVANYEGGSVALLPVNSAGGLAEATDVVEHAGAGPHPTRQDRPHAHSITLDPAGRYALAADLGMDEILVYQVDAARGRLVPHGAARVASAGAGPRHLAFAPDGRFAYVINELDSTLTTWEYDAGEGRLRERGTASTLPVGFTGTSIAADVHVHPSGLFVYGSNRGHDSIAVFSVQPETGAVRQRHVIPTGGQTPRNFAIDPTGAYLVAAHQDTHTLDTFAIDPRTGSLTPTGHSAPVPSPVCVQIVSQRPHSDE